MKRLIEFRGKAIGSNTWLYGGLVIFEDGTHAICYKEANGQKPSAPVNRDTVGMFVTHDREGNKLYEGDIVKIISPGPFVETYKIHFDEETKSFVFMGTYSGQTHPIKVKMHNVIIPYLPAYKLVKNIYDK